MSARMTAADFRRLAEATGGRLCTGLAAEFAASQQGGTGRTATKPRRNQPEQEQQIALFAWARLWEEKYQALRWMHSSGNGYNLSTEAARDKANKSGRRAGVWDVLLPVATRYDSGTICGLYIEMKNPALRGRGDKALTKEQAEFREALDWSHQFVVCFTWVQAARAVCEYLGLNPAELGVPDA